MTKAIFQEVEGISIDLIKIKRVDKQIGQGEVPLVKKSINQTR